jgi:hypothetical protein
VRRTLTRLSLVLSVLLLLPVHQPHTM